MTLSVQTAAPAERDAVFSQALRQHARSLELTQRMPVGAWSYGQGIRCAQADKYFWGLSSKSYLPLGLNHPVTLVTTVDSDTEIVAQNFAADLIKVYPQLADWQWTLLAPKHEWLKRTVDLAEEVTLRSPLGWSGFAELSRLKTWTVRLSDDVIWVASTESLPAGLAAPGERAWLKVFLSQDALGPQGRLQELRSVLTNTFSDAQVDGLCVTLTGNAQDLAIKGLACDDLGEQVRLNFPLSFLPEDLTGVRELFPLKG